jgi:hypothetical protein
LRPAVETAGYIFCFCVWYFNIACGFNQGRCILIIKGQSCKAYNRNGYSLRPAVETAGYILLFVCGISI